RTPGLPLFPYTTLFRSGEAAITGEWLDSLEEALLRADLSVSLVDPLIAQLRDLFNGGELKTVPKALTAVRETLVAALAGDVRLRSEEHTSELQSPYDLV